jgi:hypothetical protein
MQLIAEGFQAAIYRIFNKRALMRRRVLKLVLENPFIKVINIPVLFIDALKASTTGITFFREVRSQPALPH